MTKLRENKHAKKRERNAERTKTEEKNADGCTQRNVHTTKYHFKVRPDMKEMKKRSETGMKLSFNLPVCHKWILHR